MFTNVVVHRRKIILISIKTYKCYLNSIIGNKTQMSELRTTFNDNYVAYQHAYKLG